MATYTPKIDLKKPNAADAVRLADFNENWDKLDAHSHDLTDLGGVLSVEHGGHGADNPADARVNLGAASKEDLDSAVADVTEQMTNLREIVTEQVDTAQDDLQGKMQQLDSDLTERMAALETNTTELVDNTITTLRSEMSAITTDVAATMEQVESDFAGRMDALAAAKCDKPIPLTASLPLSGWIEEVSEEFKFKQVATVAGIDPCDYLYIASAGDPNAANYDKAGVQIKDAPEMNKALFRARSLPKTDVVSQIFKFQLGVAQVG